ncbi:hypothetical protein HII17_00990 [Thalassotalea sp. M1531]|uniref:YdhG-like domain-containing protein n=1 Tax=Thalassotalea algicola TaxID=2716224 RepID=A0A7Y0Q5B0_9GAMM|nr:DUF1801 domain-containing protein [Thalassotalea algicola]NMP30123.1 hypothetical protein [Thalassotalea algicola]
MAENEEITQYIEQASNFAQPILIKLRALIHQAAPDIDEVIKWRQPCFEKNGLICATAAFKKHINFSFFNGKHLTDKSGMFTDNENNNLGSIKITSLDTLPADDIIIDFIQQAIVYNRQEKPKKTVTRKDKSTLTLPSELKKALTQNCIAQEQFEQMSYSKQKDYVDWINGAKRQTTKEKRLNTAIEWISEGKGRNWKYENC